jgi:hypothetical protein
VFTNSDPAETWFEENDPVAFEYPVTGMDGD